MQDICYPVFQHWYTVAQCPRRSYFHYSKSFFPIVCHCFVLTSSPLNVTRELFFIIVHFKTTVAWKRSLKQPLVTARESQKSPRKCQWMLHRHSNCFNLCFHRTPINYLLVNIAVNDVLYSTSHLSELIFRHFPTKPGLMSGVGFCLVRNPTLQWAAAVASI